MRVLHYWKRASVMPGVTVALFDVTIRDSGRSDGRGDGFFDEVLELVRSEGYSYELKSVEEKMEDSRA